MGHQEVFGTDATNASEFAIVYVSSLNSFAAPNPLTGKTELVDGVNYQFTKPIDLGTIEFALPLGGNVEFSSTNIRENVLTTRLIDSANLFDGQPLTFTIRNLTIESPAGSVATCFNIIKTQFTPASTLYILDSSVGGFDRLGNLEGLNIVSSGCNFISNEGGFYFTNMLFIKFTNPTFFDHEGMFFIMDGFLLDGFFTDVRANPEVAGAIFEISASLVFILSGGIIITGNRLIGTDGTLFSVGGLDETHPRIVVSGNANVKDSAYIASTGFTANATETVFSDTTTFIKVTGAYVTGVLERFTDNNGTLTYIGLEPLKVQMKGSISPLVTPDIETDIIEASLFINETEVVITRVQKTLNEVFQSPNPVMPPSICNPLILTGDTVELRWRNTSGTRSVAATNAKLVVG